MPGKLKNNPGSGLREMIKLFRFLKPYRWLFTLGLLFLLISTGASLMFPKLLGDMVDMDNKGKMMKEIKGNSALLKKSPGICGRVKYYCGTGNSFQIAFKW